MSWTLVQLESHFFCSLLPSKKITVFLRTSYLFFYRDIFPYLDEDAQDAVFYQEEDESTFVSVPLLAQKLEKEVNNLFNNPQLRQDGATSSPSTILVGLMETMNKVASQLLDLSETEPYGVKGARVILKLRSNNGKEQNVGSFTLDQCTVRNHQRFWNIIFALLIFERYFRSAHFKSLWYWSRPNNSVPH